MGYCRHSQAVINENNAKIEKYTKEKSNCESLKEQAVAIKAMLEAFATSIRNVGYYLSYVQINNESFDKDECENQANSIMDLVDEIDSFISSLDTAINEYQSDIDTCQSIIDSTPYQCYSCQLAAQQAAEAAKAEAAKTASGGGGGGASQTRVAMVK